MPRRYKDRTGYVRKALLLTISVTSGLHVMGQHTEQDLPKNDSLREASRLFDIMKKGEIDGRFRQYTMFTVNNGTPSDYYAVAFGGVLGYSSERWHRVQFAMSVGYTFDLASSDLTVTDPVTGLYNRYEIGLFDVTDPRSTNDVAYLQKFQLNYLSRSTRTRFVFGKQELNTPFLNAQDGRMHPSLFEGAWANHTITNGPKLEGGWIYRIAPRSTGSWYRVDESVAIYPAGRNTTGTPSNHGEYQDSRGIVALSAKQALTSRMSLTVWDLFVENMFNTAMAQFDAGKPEERWSFSAMVLAQGSVAHGVPAQAENAYMPQGEESYAGSTRIRYAEQKFSVQANYTRITAHGRYLMPREWGRDPFFTFLPRERNEGAGDMNAASINLIWKEALPGLRLQTDGGIYWMPDVTDVRLNKYAMPSYSQFDVNAQYQFHGGWQGLAAQFLVLAKLPMDPSTLNDKQAFNKVGMLHADLIINYIF